MDPHAQLVLAAKEFGFSFVLEKDGSHYLEFESMRLRIKESQYYSVDYKSQKAVDTVFFMQNVNGGYDELFTFTSLDYRDSVLVSIGIYKNFMRARTPGLSIFMQ